MMKKMNFSEIKVDTTAIEEAGNNARKTIENGRKIVLKCKLAKYKILTVVGQIPESLCPEVVKLIQEMRYNNWLSEEDKEWCKEHHFF